MWKALFSVAGSIFSSSLSTVTKDLKEAYAAKLNSKTESERIESQERINLLEARKDIILAAQSDPVEKWVRILFAVSPITYVFKVMVWDKVLGWGITDNLSPEFWNFFMLVVGGYFIQTTVRELKK